MAMNILLVGAAGLVGQGVLRVLLQDPGEPQVTVLVRRPFRAASPRVRVMQVAEFSTAALERLDLGGFDACLYCAGPLPLLLSEQAYREATVGVLERVSSAFARANAGGYLVYVSGAAADAGSRWMPLRVKGQAEQVPGRAGLASTCLRPGGIRPNQGERSPHRIRRVIYGLGTPVLALAEKLMPASFTTTEAVGRCMLALVRAGAPYPPIVENRQISAFAAR